MNAWCWLENGKQTQKKSNQDSIAYFITLIWCHWHQPIKLHTYDTQCVHIFTSRVWQIVSDFFSSIWNISFHFFFLSSGCVRGICRTGKTTWCSCKNWSSLFAMDTICSASADYIILAPGELLCAAINTMDALIGHSSEFKQQLHQFCGSKSATESAAAPSPAAWGSATISTTVTATPRAR